MPIKEKILFEYAKEIRDRYDLSLHEHEQLGDIIDERVEDHTDNDIYEALTKYGLDEAYAVAYKTFREPRIRQVLYTLYEYAWNTHQHRFIDE